MPETRNSKLETRNPQPMKILFRRLITILFVAGVVGAIVFGLMPAPVEVDLATIEQGSIRVTVDQDGKTRIREKYVVSAPLAGRLLRIELEPGDQVEAGKTLLASIEPRDPELLDARSIAQAEARVKAAEAAVQKMEPLLEEAQAIQEFAESELQRVRDARSKSPKSISLSEVERKLLAYRTRTALLRTTKHNREIANFELDQARAALIHSRPQAACGWSSLRHSPKFRRSGSKNNASTRSSIWSIRPKIAPRSATDSESRLASSSPKPPTSSKRQPARCSASATSGPFLGSNRGKTRHAKRPGGRSDRRTQRRRSGRRPPRRRCGGRHRGQTEIKSPRFGS